MFHFFESHRNEVQFCFLYLLKIPNRTPGFIINHSHLARPRNLNEYDFSAERSVHPFLCLLVDRFTIPMVDREERSRLIYKSGP